MVKNKRLIGGVLVVVCVLVLVRLLPLAAWLDQFKGHVSGLGALGWALFFLVYVGLGVVGGATIATLAGGAMYGLWGVLLVSPASVTAATIAFVLGRTVARDSIQRKVEGDPRFTAIDKAVGDNGFKFVALLRLSPAFPFTLLNYGLGLTSVRLPTYVLASFIGMLPGTFLYVYLGTFVESLTDPVDAGAAGHLMLTAGLLATVTVTAMVTRLAKNALNERLEG